MPRVHHVKKARKAIKEYDIKVGDSYYWWKFRYGGKRVSKTPPRRSQLTQSGYLSQLYDIQDRIGEAGNDIVDADGLVSFIEEIKSSIEELRSEAESSLENMPEHLQESSSSGEILRERIDTLEQAESDFDSIETDYEEPDEDELRTEVLEEEGWDEDDEDFDEEAVQGKIEDKKAEKFQEWLDEKLQELADIDLGG
jgi:hypothetical protein